MRILPIITGLIAGAVGAAIWAGIAYATHRELGIIAWGVGLLVGIGTVLGSRGDQSDMNGVIAGVIALVTVGAGKFAAVHFIVENEVAKIHQQVRITDDDAKVKVARQVVNDFNAKKKKVVWPEGKTFEDAESKDDFPKDVWKEAEARWKKMPGSEQAAVKKSLEEEHAALLAFAATVKDLAFKKSFSIFDALWLFLAVGTAFKVAGGYGGGDD